MKVERLNPRERLKRKIRAHMSGTESVPRISVSRSNKHISAQAIDDGKGITLAHATDLKFVGKKKQEEALAVGKNIAELLLAKGIKKAVFDRNGYRYHGRIKAVAEGARGCGLVI